MTGDRDALAFIAEHAKLPAELVERAMRYSRAYVVFTRSEGDASLYPELDFAALRKLYPHLANPDDQTLSVAFGMYEFFLVRVGGLTHECAWTFIIAECAWLASIGAVDPAAVLVAEAQSRDWLAIASKSSAS